MSSYLVPCVWSMAVIIGLVIYLSNPVKEKIQGWTGYLWKNIGFGLLPQDYYQLNDSQKIEFWKTAAKWRKRRVLRAILFTPLIWVGGFLIVFVGSMVKITPASAEGITPTITSTSMITPTQTEYSTPTKTPTPTITNTPMATFTRTTLPPTQTPRVVYIQQTVISREVIPVVVTVVSTVIASPTIGPTQTPWFITNTPGPTQTPWLVTVIVTETYTPTATATPTNTEVIP